MISSSRSWACAADPRQSVDRPQRADYSHRCSWGPTPDHSRLGHVHSAVRISPLSVPLQPPTANNASSSAPPDQSRSLGLVRSRAISRTYDHARVAVKRVAPNSSRRMPSGTDNDIVESGTCSRDGTGPNSSRMRATIGPSAGISTSIRSALGSSSARTHGGGRAIPAMPPSHRLPWVAHEALLSAWRGEHGGTDSAACLPAIRGGRSEESSSLAVPPGLRWLGAGLGAVRRSAAGTGRAGPV